MVAPSHVGRGHCGRRTLNAVRGSTLGAFLLQQPALADSLRAPKHQGAAALVVFISKTTFDHNGEPSITHSFDTGAAWQNFALEASLKNLVVHGMEGFDYDKARTVLKIPRDFQVEVMAAIGKPGKKEELPVGLQERETPNDRRKLTETITEGPYIA